MKLTQLVYEDFINYKKPAMFLGTTYCAKNCEGCQNNPLRTAEIITISNEKLIERYKENKITKAIVLGGLDPFDTPEETFQFCCDVRFSDVEDDIVIYTGFTEEELKGKPFFKPLIELGNITIKYGRFIINDEKIYDEVLGVNLASRNQYAIKY